MNRMRLCSPLDVGFICLLKNLNVHPYISTFEKSFGVMFIDYLIEAIYEPKYSWLLQFIAAFFHTVFGFWLDV